MTSLSNVSVSSFLVRPKQPYNIAVSIVSSGGVDKRSDTWPWTKSPTCTTALYESQSILLLLAALILQKLTSLSSKIILLWAKGHLCFELFVNPILYPHKIINCGELSYLRNSLLQTICGIRLRTSALILLKYSLPQDLYIYISHLWVKIETNYESKYYFLITYCFFKDTGFWKSNLLSLYV